MIPVKIKVIGIMVLCGILLNGCTGSAYINNSMRGKRMENRKKIYT